MTKLFVYGVNANCPRDKLEKEFAVIGDVTDCFITGKGYAFVTMANHEDAERAIEKLHGAEVDGQEIKVEEARARYVIKSIILTTYGAIYTPKYI